VKGISFQIITIVSLLLFSIISSSIVKLVYAQAGQISLIPTDDTYVSRTNATSNFGTYATLEVMNGTFAIAGIGGEYINDDQMIWLKFNLSSIPEGAVIDYATLQLCAESYGTSYPANVSAYYCPDNSWNETELTYSNMPSYNTTSIDTLLDNSEIEWGNWSVAEALRDSLNNNSTFLTIVLAEPISTWGILQFYSKEIEPIPPDDRPKLIVHWTVVVPEFPTFIALAFLMIVILLIAIIGKCKNLSSKQSISGVVV